MIKITLEADGFNKQVLTDNHFQKLGARVVAQLIMAWLCMFYKDELFNYVLKDIDDGKEKS